MMVTQALNGLDFQHNLYQYASTSGAPYSDMNGYGHFLKGWAWFNAYWAALALALLIIASAFWPRGLSESLAIALARRASSSDRRPAYRADRLAYVVRARSAAGSSTTRTF